MGCACGKKNVGPVAHTYTDETGHTTTHRTEIAAKAAQVRNGGQGAVKPVTK